MSQPIETEVANTQRNRALLEALMLNGTNVTYLLDKNDGLHIRITAPSAIATAVLNAMKTDQVPEKILQK